MNTSDLKRSKPKPHLSRPPAHTLREIARELGIEPVRLAQAMNRKKSTAPKPLPFENFPADPRYNATRYYNKQDVLKWWFDDFLLNGTPEA